MPIEGRPAVDNAILDAEEAVIASLILDGGEFWRVADLLEPGDFWREKNKWCWEAMVSLSKRREEIHQVSVAYELAHAGRLEAVGGNAYLAGIVEALPTSVHLTHYAAIVRRAGEYRRLEAIGQRILALGQAGGTDPQGAISQGMQLLLDLAKSRAPVRAIKDVLADHWAEQVEWAREPDRIRGLTTGFGPLDRLMDGYRPGRLYLIMARPGMGKSQFCLHTAQAGLAQGGRPLLFSLEMSASAIIERMVLARGGLDRYELRHRAEADIEETIIEAQGALSELPIYIFDKRGARMIDLQATAHNAVRNLGVNLLIVDYLELLTDRGESEHIRINRLGTELRNLAGELSVPIVVAHQLSRANEARQDKRPILADAREAGEQAPDVVLGLYRESYYRDGEWRRANPSLDKILEVGVLKNREGPTGLARIYWDYRTGKMGELHD